MARKPLTRWQELDRACLAVDPECRVRVPSLSRQKAEARLASLTPEAFEAETRETVEFLARMRAKTLEIRAAFYACMEAREAAERAEVRHVA